MKEEGAEIGYPPRFLTSTYGWIRWKIPSCHQSPQDKWFFSDPGTLGQKIIHLFLTEYTRQVGWSLCLHLISHPPLQLR